MDEGCGAGLEAVSDSENCAVCDFFPDDKNGSAVEAVADDETSAIEEAGRFFGDEAEGEYCRNENIDLKQGNNERVKAD